MVALSSHSLRASRAEHPVKAIQNRQQGRLLVKLEERMAHLVLNCDGVDLVTDKLGNVTTIGRAPSNHIVIDNPAVSAQHAIIGRSADSYRLKDLDSTNGTQVNGVFITDVELKDGDKIRFGSVVAVFAG
jgi:FHA domain